MALVVKSMQLMHLSRNPTEIGGVFAERGSGVGNEHPYSLVYFGATLNVTRSNESGRIFRVLKCRLSVPVFNIETVCQPAIDMMADDEIGQAKVEILSLPLGFVQPTQSALKIEFLDGVIVLASMTVPIIFPTTSSESINKQTL